MKKKGVLVVNLGTPDEPTIPAVRRYLKEFLSDPLVIDIPGLLRWVLLTFFILPFRPRKSAEAYQEIWTEQGSPLLVYSAELAEKLQVEVGDEYQVVLAMRYGNPSITQGVQQLKEAGCDDWVVAPLYPQHALSTSESSWQAVCNEVRRAYHGQAEPTLHELSAFYDNKHYISALQKITMRSLAGFNADHVLMSYHGLPVRQLRAPVCNQCSCDRLQQPCPPVTGKNKDCYRAHCFATSEALAQAVGLSQDQYTVSFQSRLGRAQWIGPDTESVIEQLYEKGVRRLAVAMPSFVVDCLETLEEIGIRLREDWLAMPDTEFHLIPCLNADSEWVTSFAALIDEVLPIKRIL